MPFAQLGAASLVVAAILFARRDGQAGTVFLIFALATIPGAWPDAF